MAILSPLLPRIGTPLRSQLDAPAPLRLWHLTSLDAPTVAVTWTLALAWSAHVRLPVWLPIVLGFAAWSFYIADRLFDARHARTPLRARHHFHWQYRRIFVPLTVVAMVIAIILVLHSMPLTARARNSVLAAAALAYFTSVHVPWRPKIYKLPFAIPKELLVAVIFTLACAIPTWARAGANHLSLLAPILVFVALAWLNCYAIEVWESQFCIPGHATFRLALALTGIAVFTAIIAAALHQNRQAALLAAAALSSTLLALLDWNRRRLTPLALRCAADLVLLTPIALLALS